MPPNTHKVFGQDITFRADADPERVKRACVLLEEKHKRLAENTRILSKEKLLTFIALSLADDIVELQDEKKKMDERMRKLLGDMENLV